MYVALQLQKSEDFVRVLSRQFRAPAKSCAVQVRAPRVSLRKLNTAAVGMDGSESSCRSASGVIGADGFFWRIDFAILERIAVKG